MSPPRRNLVAEIASFQLQIMLAATIFLPLIGAAAPRVSAQTCSGQSSISYQFNGNGIGGGNYIWFNAVAKVTGTSSSPITVTLTNGTYTLAAAGTTYTLPVPDSKIIIAPGTPVATTTS